MACRTPTDFFALSVVSISPPLLRRQVRPGAAAPTARSTFVQHRRFTMKYIDGFVAAVPSNQQKEYLEHARLAAVVFKELGALNVVETWGDDVPDGKLTSFPMAVQRKADETVVFSWITWPSKQARDEGMKKFMEDPRVKDMQMPFDGQRMIYGGFAVILEA